MISEEIPLLLHVCGGAETRLDVLFVHGLTGAPEETWTSPDGSFWPKWLCADLPGASIYTLGYPASVFGQWAKKEMDLHERAASMLEHLAALGIGKRPIALICHSLGGILAKEILRTSAECNDDSWRRIADNTRFVAFLATPHTGASLAAAIKLAVPRLSSHYIELLSNDSGYLTSLNQSYRDLVARNHIITVPYYEKHKYKSLALIVSRQSADPGVGSVRCIPVDADHVSICKPADQDAPVYASLSRRLGEVADQCVSAVSVDSSLQGDDYSVRSESDRRDLHQKMIDAGREDEYATANELQNRFARRYYRHGLYTEAKANSDAILAQVEQRFITHVYDKIRKRASYEEIASALQTYVIDPLTVPGSGVSASVVLQAVYFLTEQCFLRWDAP